MMGRIVVLALVLWAAAERPAEACSCAPPAPPCQAFWTADAVFSGTVVNMTVIQPPPPRPRIPRYEIKVTLRVEKVLRGGIDGNVEIYTTGGGGDCGFRFQEGKQYIVYARRAAGKLRASTCSRTKRLADAEEDEAYFEDLKRPATAAGGRIYGVVTAPEAPRSRGNYKVTIGNETGEWSALTNTHGRFEFTGRAPGSYAVRVDVPDTHRVYGSTLVHLRDSRACAFTTLTVLPAGRVSLHVLTTEGRPAVRATLELIEAQSQRSEAPNVRIAETGPDGSVRGDVVSPGPGPSACQSRR